MYTIEFIEYLEKNYDGHTEDDVYKSYLIDEDAKHILFDEYLELMHTNHGLIDDKFYSIINIEDAESEFQGQVHTK